MSKITKSTPYKHLMVLMNIAGLSERQERLFIASKILKRDVMTFTSLTDDDVARLVSFFDGWRIIQEQRMYNGVMAIESCMVLDMVSNLSNRKTLSSDNFLSTPKKRRQFMELYELNESDYHVDEDFDSILDSITSKASRKTVARRLTPYVGKWPKWRLVSAPTVNLGLATNIGGIPRGKMVHLWGEKHAGKSYLSYAMIAQAQKEGMYCVLFDTEAAATGSLVEELGVDLDKLAVITPVDLEDLGDMLREAVQHKNMFLVVDSIAGSESGAELERDLSKASKVGGNANLWKRILNTTRAPLQDNGSTIIFINQVRAKLSASTYEYPYKSFGGQSVGHSMDMSFRVSSVTPTPKSLKPKGYLMSRILIDKNRLSGRSSCELLFYPGLPYDAGMNLIKGTISEVAVGTNLTYGEMADNVFLMDKKFNPKTGNVVGNKDNAVIRVDPWMLAALLKDEPDGDFLADTGSDMEPAADFDIHKEVPPVDIDNYVYMNVPERYFHNIGAWLNNHPATMHVIEQRLIDGLDNRQRVIEGIAGVVRPLIEDDEPSDDTSFLIEDLADEEMTAVDNL